jgi:hypothetical protein
MKSEKKFLVTEPTGATGGETVEQFVERHRTEFGG